MIRAFPVYDRQDEIKRMVFDGVKGETTPHDIATSAAIGFADAGGRLLAGFAFHGYDPAKRRVEISAWSPGRGWYCRNWPAILGNYVFGEMGCDVAVVFASENNAPVRRIWKTLGATETIVPDLWQLGEGAAICVLTRQAWKSGGHDGTIR